MTRYEIPDRKQCFREYPFAGPGSVVSSGRGLAYLAELRPPPASPADSDVSGAPA